ncbi:hypothetical protein CHAB381_0341 [Campylobacter hominis ATCC BAA-381]|uniref:Uncharacterized protein n=1 Tax=Campylobacter hominis (strain ATCC BAA-381 / DSM 21671 / CCUG 45161 / LMG 19568 / NCTC 13146 / CH001A) TaxID=360107 RepID=A7I0A2_CAMHC|nr:hypothetical protein CHAB381_0341 [Campylobacter hominis ATCC BAA-381]
MAFFRDIIFFLFKFYLEFYNNSAEKAILQKLRNGEKI